MLYFQGICMENFFFPIHKKVININLIFFFNTYPDATLLGMCMESCIFTLIFQH